MSSANFKFFGKMGREGPLFRKMTPKTSQTSAFHLEAGQEIVYHKGCLLYTSDAADE